MYMLVTYDVSTQDKKGQRRLRKVAKCCLDYGQRVQQSVFELNVNPAQWAECKRRLESTVDPALDSLRYYYLGNDWHRRIEQFGVVTSFDIDGPLFA